MVASRPKSQTETCVQILGNPIRPGQTTSREEEMKPDGVITAALEPMETLESNPVNELSPVTGQQPSQGPGGAVEEVAQGPKDVVPPRPEKAKESPSAKTSNKISGDPKAKTANKTAQKTKPSTTNVTKTTSGSRPSTTLSRLSNGLSKPQSNGVTKKTTPTLEKKSTPTSAAPKKPTAGVPAPRSTAKVTERKTATPATQGAKSAVGVAAIKKATSATVNGVKTGTAGAAKKPPAPKPAAATSTKSTTAPKTDKPPVSKTRPTTGTTASRPTTGSTRPPSTITTRSPAATSKPATPKTSATGANSVATKSASSTPSAVKTPASQTSRNITPAKKDVTKSATPAAKKSADSPLSRPSATLKSTRSEAPKPASKSDSLAKKPSVSKVADTKAPNRSKTQENKSTPSKDVAKTPASKTVATKNTSAKKTVGSSTPTPVKRGPKAEEAAETGGEIAAAVAAAAAIASAAATIVGSNESQSPAEVALVESHGATAEQMPPTIPSAFAVQGIISDPTAEPSTEQAYELTPEIQQEKIPEPRQEPTPEPIRETAPEPMREPSPEPIPQPTPEYIREPTPEFIREPSPVPVREQTSEIIPQPTPEFIREPTPEPILQPSAESIREPTPQPVRELTPEPQREQSPEPLRESSPEPMGEFTPDAVREPTPEHVLEITPQPLRALTPEPEQDSSPEPLQEITSDTTPEPSPEQACALTPEIQQEIVPEPRQEATPEPLREPTPEVLQDLPPEPVRDASIETLLESEPEPLRELTPEPVEEQPLIHACKMSPEVPDETFCQPTEEPHQGAGFSHEPASDFQQPAPNDPFKFDQSASDSVPSLGTTVMSPPCSPPVPVSQIREFQDPSDLPNMHVRPDPWNRNQTVEPCDIDPQASHSMMNFPTGERNDQDEEWEMRRDEEDEEENLMTSTAPSTEAFYAMAQPQFLGASTMEDFTSGHMLSPHEKEVAVEKADEEINEDEDDEDEEDEEQRRLGHHLSSMITDMSTSQPSEEFQIRPSAFGGSTGWHCDDLLSGMDSEDVSSCTSSRQQGISDFSSTQHTAILEGTQSSDALIDSSLRGSEGDGNFMGSPNVETLANEEDDEEDERVDDMDLSSERAEEHHHVFQQQEQDEDEEDEDVEMHSDGVTESCENAEDDDFNEAHLDNLNRADSPSVIPPTTSWGQTNPFSDTWAQPQPASLRSVSSPSPISDHGAGESESPTQPPAQTGLDSSSPFLAPLSGQDSERQRSFHELDASVPEDTPNMLAPAAVGLSQSSSLSGTALAAHSGSETSTPEELRDYDSSSGVESRSDKQHTPVPASLQPDMEQDLGIHLEKGDGEEEEAETLPADEVLGTGPPTAPASAPSSPTTSVDEASDTEGEMQINEADAPVTMDESAAFESPTPTCNLSALDEDEEARETPAGEGEEDEGETTPQSANSVASYGFDCTTSNSNAHSMAESCGKSPGIFSLENEEQLPEEAKDPSLIKELTLPPPAAAAAAQAEDLLGRPVDLMPLSFPEDKQPGLDDRHYMLGGELTAQHLEDVDPLEASLHLGPVESANTDENQPSYYSTICDKTDYLEGDKKRDEADDRLHTCSLEDHRNQNHSTAVPIANGHYLALVPGNRRPIDPTVAAQFAQIEQPSTGNDDACALRGEQLRRLQQHQEKLQEMQHRQEQERQKRQWLEEERLRLEQQKQLEKQRRELLQLQLQQQQQEHRQRRQVLQWQLELEQQYRMQQKQIQQQQQQLRRSPTGVTLSPSSGLCTIYEAMETSDEDEDARVEQNGNAQGRRRMRDYQRQLCPLPPNEAEWNQKVDIVQQLINQTLMLSGNGGCPPLLLLPVGTGGTLNRLDSSQWPNLLQQFSPPAATVTSVSSYSPDDQGASSPGDWTVVEVETQH